MWVPVAFTLSVTAVPDTAETNMPPTTISTPAISTVGFAESVIDVAVTADTVVPGVIALLPGLISCIPVVMPVMADFVAEFVAPAPLSGTVPRIVSTLLVVTPFARRLKCGGAPYPETCWPTAIAALGIDSVSPVLALARIMQ